MRPSASQSEIIMAATQTTPAMFTAPQFRRLSRGPRVESAPRPVSKPQSAGWLPHSPAAAWQPRGEGRHPWRLGVRNACPRPIERWPPSTQCAIWADLRTGPTPSQRVLATRPCLVVSRSARATAGLAKTPEARATGSRTTAMSAGGLSPAPSATPRAWALAGLSASPWAAPPVAVWAAAGEARARRCDRPGGAFGAAGGELAKAPVAPALPARVPRLP